MSHFLLDEKLSLILDKFAFSREFFDSLDIKIDDVSLSMTVESFFNSFNYDDLEEKGLSTEFLKQSFIDFMDMMSSTADSFESVDSITIIGGIDKQGNNEGIDITISRGEIICIVGPTGSGKSRLLADIEWIAQKDTPTKRQILINGNVPDKGRRFSIEHKLVAQLSQNMNFVMDLTVEEFVRLHAESRLVEKPDEKVEKIINQANELAGEKFLPSTPITSLSGGQSRALMIADTAILSKSPIVLIDEIENAGIDRKKALQLLVKEEKIVLMATHDPILALMGHKRLVLKNGAVSKIIESSEEEKGNLKYLEELDNKLLELRNRLRRGESLTVI